MMMWKVVSKTEDPARRQTDSSGSNPPSRFSVHSLVGLDNNEMDCFRRQASTLLSWSLLIGTTNVPKRKIELQKYGCFWTSSMCRKSPPWPWVLPCPGVGLALHGLLLLLVLLCLFDCLAQSCKLRQMAISGRKVEHSIKFAPKLLTFTNLHTSPTLFTPTFRYFTQIYIPYICDIYMWHIYMWHFLDPCLAVMVLIYGKLLALLSPHFIINIIIAITHFAFPPNPLNWRKSQKWPIGDNLSIWRLDWVRIF